MRIHPVNFLAAIVISALITYGTVSLDSNTLKGVIGIGCFLFLAATLSMTMGVSFENGRVGANVKVVSVLFFIVALILNLVFGFFVFSQTSYIITSGIFFLLYVVIANGIFGARQ